MVEKRQREINKKREQIRMNRKKSYIERLKERKKEREIHMFEQIKRRKGKERK